MRFTDPDSPDEWRLRVWKATSGRDIAFYRFDVAENYQRLLDLLPGWRHRHRALRRAALRAVLDEDELPQVLYRQQHNATNNLLTAVVDSGQDLHIVYLRPACTDTAPPA